MIEEVPTFTANEHEVSISANWNNKMDWTFGVEVLESEYLMQCIRNCCKVNVFKMISVNLETGSSIVPEGVENMIKNEPGLICIIHKDDINEYYSFYKIEVAD